jgi:hypothetical protein
MGILGNLLGGMGQPTYTIGPPNPGMGLNIQNQQNAIYQGIQGGQGGFGNLLGGPQQYAQQAQQAAQSQSIEDPGYQLDLDSCISLWEAHFGDRWISGQQVDVEYKIVMQRMMERRWFEITTLGGGLQYYRLLPEKYRK